MLRVVLVSALIFSSAALSFPAPQAPTPTSPGLLRSSLLLPGSLSPQLLSPLRLRGGISEELKEKLEKLLKQDKIMVFMKGSPEDPQCGFSRQMVHLLNEHDVTFTHFDILEDQDVRQGLKEYSDWPTYPQVYSGGTLIGGLDILKDLRDEGVLKAELGLEEEVQELVTAESVEAKLKERLEAEHVEVEDHSGASCGLKLSALVVSEKFEDMPLVERQRLVHSILKPELKDNIHALTLKCKTPKQWQAQGG